VDQTFKRGLVNGQLLNLLTLAGQRPLFGFYVPLVINLRTLADERPLFCF
jgi:hypothetical protein